MPDNTQTIAPGASEDNDMDALAHRLHATLVVSEPYTLFENLSRMPNELFDKIVGCLDLKEQAELSITCKTLLARVKPVMDEFVWGDPPVPLYQMGKNGCMHPEYVALAEKAAPDGYVACPWCRYMVHSPLRSMEPHSGFKCAEFSLTSYNGYQIRGIHPLVIYAIPRWQTLGLNVNRLLDSAEQASFEDSDDIRRKQPASLRYPKEKEDHPHSFDRWLYSQNIQEFKWSWKLNWVPGRGLFLQRRYSVLCPTSGWRFLWRLMLVSFWLFVRRLSESFSLSFFWMFLRRFFATDQPSWQRPVCGCGKYRLKSYPLLLQDFGRFHFQLIHFDTDLLAGRMLSAADVRSRELAISPVKTCEECRSDFQVAVRKVMVKADGSNSNSDDTEACWVHHTTWIYVGKEPIDIEYFCNLTRPIDRLGDFVNIDYILQEYIRWEDDMDAGDVVRLSGLSAAY